MIAKNCRRQQPHSHLRPPPRGTPASIRIYLIFPETRVIGLHAAIVWVYLHSNLHSMLQKTHLFCTRVRFGHSRSSKVNDFGTNRKRVCDFLLVGHCDYSPILHRFGAMTRFMCSWPHPYSTVNLGVFPLHQIAHVGVTKRMDLKLFRGEIIFEVFQPMWKLYLNVTDRRTDGRTDRRLTVA